MIIRVVEHPMDHMRRKMIYEGCGDEFSRQSNNPAVHMAIDGLKHSEHAFTHIRGTEPECKTLYFIARIDK